MQLRPQEWSEHEAALLAQDHEGRHCAMSLTACRSTKCKSAIPVVMLRPTLVASHAAQRRMAVKVDGAIVHAVAVSPLAPGVHCVVLQWSHGSGPLQVPTCNVHHGRYPPPFHSQYAFQHE